MMRIFYFGNYTLNLPIVNKNYISLIGDKRYELANHLGNVLAVINDKKIPAFTNAGVFSLYFNADVLSYSDYYPFGQLVPNRHGSSESYRYGFQGQEKDDEIKGEGNSLNYTFRMHDPRIGRFLSIDPLADKRTYHSPYMFCGNDPISNIDPDGRYFFGLFGSTSSERRMARAERFAQKVNGTVMTLSNGRPSVNFITLNSGGDYVLNNQRSFSDFSSWKNFKSTMIGFDSAIQGNSDGTNSGGYYGGESGQQKFIDETGDVSTYVKIGGLGVSASSIIFGPGVVPIGIGIFEAGEAMDKTSTALQIGKDVADKNYDTAAVRFTSEIVTL
jgi:RHS repeat-associated protein